MSPATEQRQEQPVTSVDSSDAQLPLSLHNNTAAYGRKTDRQLLTKVKQIFQNHPQNALTEPEFIKITEACQLPTYLNIAFFQSVLSFAECCSNGEPSSSIDQSDATVTTSSIKEADEAEKKKDHISHTAEEETDQYASTMDTRVVTLAAFERCWSYLMEKGHKDNERFLFEILLLQRKRDADSTNYLIPEDFLPILEDIIFNHPALQFLVDNPTFQEKYIETVICRLFYDAKCPLGRMSHVHFRRSNFTDMITQLTPEVDLNTTKDCFSYKHFYVLYCKFWMLDDDHDLSINGLNLQTNYNDGVLPTKLIEQIMQNGQIPAFRRAEQQPPSAERVLHYFDFIWLFLSEIDKSTPVAIEYWFRCMDSDGDGIITTFDLHQYWEEQDRRLRATMMDYLHEEPIQFDDLIRQLNDLIQPRTPGQFCLSDLKKNGLIAERFFDTFLNIDKFLIHDSSQGLIRINISAEKEKKRKQLMLQQQQFQKRAIEQLINDETENNNIADGFSGLYSQDSAKSQTDTTITYRHSNAEPRPQQLLLETFCLGTWADYAETEYELLLADDDQLSTTDDNHFYQSATIVPAILIDANADGDDNEDEIEEEDDEDECCYFPDHTSLKKVTTPPTLARLVLLEAPNKNAAYRAEVNSNNKATVASESQHGIGSNPTAEGYSKICLALGEDLLKSTESARNSSKESDSDNMNSLLKGFIWPTIKDI